jgi:hypothetical protein
VLEPPPATYGKEVPLASIRSAADPAQFCTPLSPQAAAQQVNGEGGPDGDMRI